MHRPEFIEIINEVASQLNISAIHFSDNWSIRLTKNGITKYIVGYTFPLNSSVSFKIARNKNLCSEILLTQNIANVPHKLFFSPKILGKRSIESGNWVLINEFISNYGFPIVIKKNNSSSGDGVFYTCNRTELEDVLSNVFQSEKVVCLSPERKILGEFRSIVLSGKCLLTFEKNRPCLVGDGKSTISELMFIYYSSHGFDSRHENVVNGNILKQLKTVPEVGSKIFLQWKHNSAIGTNYQNVINPALNKIAEHAAEAIDAKFVSVDSIFTKEFGYEVLELNASVVLNTFLAQSKENYFTACAIYRAALEEIFI